jgi:hypothetical protein
MTIIDINATKLERGEPMFFACPKCEGVEMAVLVVNGGAKPVVTGLVCPSETCGGETHFDVVHGLIG